MSSDLLQSFLVIMALIGVMLLVRFSMATKARRPSDAAQPPRVPSAPGAAALLPAPPPVLGALETPSAPIAETFERRRRRLSLAEARNGIVLATILGACRAHRVEEPW